MSSGPIINPEAIQALRELSPEGGDEFLRELVDIYLADTPKQLDQLEQALSRQDAPLVVRAAHTIKGSSGNFGAQELAKIAQEIEHQGKAGNLASAGAALPSLKAGYALVAEALRKYASP